MSRIVNKSGSTVYENRGEGEDSFLVPWPACGFLAEYHAYPGAGTILTWHSSSDEAKSHLGHPEMDTYLDLTPEGSIGDFHLAVWECEHLLPPNDGPGAWITRLNIEAFENEDPRWYYVHQDRYRMSACPAWIDDENCAIDPCLICGPFTSERAARSAADQLQSEAPADIYYAVVWSYNFTPTDAAQGLLPSIRTVGTSDPFDRYLAAHRAARLIDGPHSHRGEGYASPGTIRRFELARAALGHGGLVGGARLEHLLDLRYSWPVPSWVLQDPLRMECLGRIPDLPNGLWTRGYLTPWPAMAARYVSEVDNLSREDDFGFSGGILTKLQDDRYAIVHRTCTGNTVLICTEHYIGGWSWTRSEVAGIPLTFGPPPDWLTPYLSLSSSPQFQESMEYLLKTRGDEVHESYLRRAVSWLTYEQCERLPEELRARIPAE